jgi:hypothetical protein
LSWAFKKNYHLFLAFSKNFIIVIIYRVNCKTENMQFSLYIIQGAMVNEEDQAAGHISFLLYIVIAFFIGAVLGGIFSYILESATIGGIDRRYSVEHGRAAETIGKLTAELERERELNRELRDHNSKARAIAGGLAGTVERNVRNLQEAISLIGEIRKKLQVLADFYNNSSPVGSDTYAHKDANH